MAKRGRHGRYRRSGAGLAHLAETIRRQVGIDVASLRGGGAAGASLVADTEATGDLSESELKANAAANLRAAATKVAARLAAP